VRRLDVDLPARLAASPLLRHCTLALDLSPLDGQPFPPPVITDAELSVIAELPRLRSLDTRGRALQPTQFAALLQHPALAGLTSLYTVRHQMDSVCTALLPLHQRGLHTLHVESPSRPSPTFFAPLPLLPALTDLSAAAAWSDGCGVVVVGQCASLRRLTLGSLPPAEWLPVLLSPALRRLESLCLWKLLVRDFDPCAAAFHNLPALHSLQLRCCPKIGTQLAAIAAVPSAFRSLRRLRISPELLDAQISVFGAYVPSISRLHSLLAALPDLAVLELEMPPQPQPRLPNSASAGDSAHGQPSAGVSASAGGNPRLLQWPRVHQQFLELQQAHPQRVRILFA